MNTSVSLSTAVGKVTAPASKSAMQRYIAGSLLAEGLSEINSFSLCDDTMAALSIAEALGAKVSVKHNKVTIRGGFKPVMKEIICGESGLSARMFTPIAALHDQELTLNGKGSILNRPLDMVEQPLTGLGVRVISDNGHLPLKIRGPLKGGDVTADGSLSSQFITGLLMALPVTGEDSRIYVENLVSKPYIDLTLSVLEEFGIKIFNDSYRLFSVSGRQKYRPGSFTAEGDWSGAAFLLVLGAMAGNVTVTGIKTDSTQADKAILKALSLTGANIKITRDTITVKQAALEGFEFDVSECPDLAPPLAVLALACRGKSVLTGTERLSAKESDRGKVLELTMNLIGGRVKNLGNTIEIDGGTRLKGGRASSFNDHRIAMALAVSSALCESPVVVEGMECINKSYPGFIEDLTSLGVNITNEK